MSDIWDNPNQQVVRGDGSGPADEGAGGSPPFEDGTGGGGPNPTDPVLPEGKKKAAKKASEEPADE